MRNIVRWHNIPEVFEVELVPVGVSLSILSLDGCRDNGSEEMAESSVDE